MNNDHAKKFRRLVFAKSFGIPHGTLRSKGSMNEKEKRRGDEKTTDYLIDFEKCADKYTESDRESAQYCHADSAVPWFDAGNSSAHESKSKER